jgi:hypothetical protein
MAVLVEERLVPNGQHQYDAMHLGVTKRFRRRLRTASRALRGR